MNYSQQNLHSSIDEWDRNLWPPFTQISTSKPPQEISNANGALLFRKDQPPLIDAISSWWVTLHGHSNPYIANAIALQAKQLEQIIFADFTHPQAIKLGKRLSQLTGLERLFFSDNGSTAVEVAIKMACQYWHNIGTPKYQIIAFEGAYHGDTFGAMAVGERNLFNAPFEKLLFPVSRVPWPSTWLNDSTVEEREQKTLKKLIDLLEKPTAAVILEPLVQGAGGMQMVRPSFLESVAKIVKESNTLLIADEVMTGFGRCGEIFASKAAKVSPDLMTLSKGLTGGFLPMGITMASEEIFKTFLGSDPKFTFWHGHSFTANPLGCAAANASLDLLENDKQSYQAFKAKHLPYIEDLMKNKKVKKARVTGTIAAFDINIKEEKGYLNTAGKLLKKYALENGVFIRPLGNIVYLLPPLCISESQLEHCYKTIKNGLESLY